MIKTNKKLLIFIAILLILAVSYSFIEPLMVGRDEIKFVSSQVPTEFVGYKIVYVADIHNGPFMNDERLNELSKRINAENPDLILLGGDYTRRFESEQLGMFRLTKSLVAKFGKYFVLGNHDYWTNSQKCIDGMIESGVIPLINQNVVISKKNHSIKLIGLDDFEEGNIQLDKAYAGINYDDFAILISHNPEVMDIMSKEQKQNSDLSLFGHTHGGQITYLGLFSPTKPRILPLLRPSLKYEDGMNYVITNGFGTSGVPIRFFAPPQFHVITLYSNEEY